MHCSSTPCFQHVGVSDSYLLLQRLFSSSFPTFVFLQCVCTMNTIRIVDWMALRRTAAIVFTCRVGLVLRDWFFIIFADPTQSGRRITRLLRSDELHCHTFGRRTDWGLIATPIIEFEDETCIFPPTFVAQSYAVSRVLCPSSPWRALLVRCRP